MLLFIFGCLNFLLDWTYEIVDFTIRYDTIQYIYVRSKADEMASFI